MKLRAGLLLLVVFLGLPLLAANEPQPNVFLSDQHFLWPVPKIETPIAAEAAFHSKAIVEKVTKGDWITTSFLITYDVIKVTRGTFAAKQLRFLCDDRMPTPESGIMIKRVPFPFDTGTYGTFYLENKDGRYLILSYDLKDAATDEKPATAK